MTRLSRLLPALIVLLCVAAPLHAEMRAVPLQWTHADTRFDGVLVHDTATRDARPGLLMFPNWMGVTDDAIERARAIAAQGHVVLVVDMYGHDVRPADASEAQAATRALYADRDALRGRAQAALATLRAQAGAVPLDASRIGAFGFCFGGAVALELARTGADIAAAVSLHGALTTPLPAQAGTVRAAVLVLNGADDTAVTAEHIAGFQREMTDAGVDWQFVNFSGAVHCFAEPSANRPPNCLYHPRSAARAYRMMHGFLDEVLGR